MIYLDYQATTPLAPEVSALMRSFLDDGVYANPHSADHAMGRAAAAIVEQARQDIARAIGARPSEVLFTSGATESNNTAIMGVMQAERKRTHMVISALEHACVMAPAQALAQAKGSCYTLDVLPVSPTGLLDPAMLRDALLPETRLVSIQWINNEIGTIQPIAEIAAICRQHGVLLHCDAAQALGRVAVNLRDVPIDLLSISAHKVYGPKGIGALFVRRGVTLTPLLHGGGQERLIRSGTLSPMLCAGFAQAVTLGAQRYQQDQQQAKTRCKQLLSYLHEAQVPFALNGDPQKRICDNLHLHFPTITTDQLLMRTAGLAISTGSACGSTKQGGSHVLRAIGIPADDTSAHIRLAVGRMTSRADITEAAEILIKAVQP